MNILDKLKLALSFLVKTVRNFLKLAKKFIKKNITWSVIFKFVIMVLVAVTATWLLQYRYYTNHAEDVWNFVENRKYVFWYTTIIMFFIVLLTYGIIRRLFLSCSIIYALIILIGYIHIEKLALRGTPLFPEDFQLGDQAGSLMSFVDGGNVMRTLLAIAIVIGIGVYLDKKLHGFLHSKRNSKKHNFFVRVSIIAIALLGFMNTTDFARNHDGGRKSDIPWLESKFTAWNQTWNYNDNGFLIAFIYNSSNSSVREPDGYSAKRIKTITKKYQSDKKKDEERTPIEDADFNVVVVLEETFYDTENVRGFYNFNAEDTTPNLHRLMQENPSGTMYSIDYGGGTANIEFEVLTGLTNYWLNVVPYTGLISKKKSVPSVAHYMKDSGFETATLHPFNGGMYKRNSVLPILGFDTFRTVDDFTHTEHENTSEYINDRSSFAETIDYLKNHDKKQFISLITMQNHIPYIADTYPDNPYVVTNQKDERVANMETYLQTLHNSDAYLGEFISAIDELDEKTIVLVYGDHSPGIFGDLLDNEDQSVRDLTRKTPYFIHANFDIEFASKDLPTTTPNCLLNTLFDSINLEKPDYLYLTAKVCKEQPILSSFYFGEKLPFNSTELSSYQLLTYDMVAGKQYSASK